MQVRPRFKLFITYLAFLRSVNDVIYDVEGHASANMGSCQRVVMGLEPRAVSDG